MSQTGGYAGPNGFRTGAAKNQIHELTLKALNEARGTAYNTDPGSIVFYENYAYAKAIAASWEILAKFANQFQPHKISSFLDRWEKILSIFPNNNLNYQQRLNVIAQKFVLWTKPPTIHNVSDIVRTLVPQIFIAIEVNAADDDKGSFPGGLNITGGVNLIDGPFSNRVSQLKVRVWQPRDKDNNVLMPLTDFYNQVNIYQTFLDNYLPAYIGFDTFRFIHQISGTVSGSTNTSSLTGSGTSFLTQLSIGQEIELVDDQNEVQSYTILNIIDNTHLTIVETLDNNSTNNFVRITGFFLDETSNLDNECL